MGQIKTFIMGTLKLFIFWLRTYHKCSLKFGVRCMLKWECPTWHVQNKLQMSYECHDLSNHWKFNCLLSNLFRITPKKIGKLQRQKSFGVAVYMTWTLFNKNLSLALCEGNQPVLIWLVNLWQVDSTPVMWKAFLCHVIIMTKSTTEFKPWQYFMQCTEGE